MAEFVRNQWPNSIGTGDRFAPESVAELRRNTQGTRLRDRVDYRLPFWLLGEVALPFVRRKVGRIFAYREKVIREILCQGD